MRSETNPMEVAVDSGVAAALEALHEARERFLSAVRLASAQVRNILEDQASAGSDRAEAAALELGGFANSRIDPSRFSALLQDRGPRLDGAAIARLREASEALEQIAHAEDGLFALETRGDEDPLPAVTARLAEIGRAFSAARAARRVRGGNTNGAVAIATLSPREWNAAERNLAPPLVVRVRSRARGLVGLADILGGRQKIVLFLDDTATAAPLARLIAPRTYVRQADPGDAAGVVHELAACTGPGVVGFVGASAARFTHDPRKGRTYSDRLAIDYLPSAEDDEELQHLSDLAAAGARPMEVSVPSDAGADPKPPREDPLDRMAAWLIARSGLDERT